MTVKTIIKINMDVSLTWMPERTVFRCVSLAVSPGSSELVLHSRILKSCQRQKRCVPPTSPALNQCLQGENRFRNSDLGSQGQSCPLRPCWHRAGSSHLPQEAAGASSTLLQSREQGDGGRARAWGKVERLSRSDAATWLACSGTTPGRRGRRNAFGWSPSTTITFTVNKKFQINRPPAPRFHGGGQK